MVTLSKGSATLQAPSYDPKKADCYHAFRQGLRDSLARKVAQKRFMEHPSRGDISKAYLRGWDRGVALMSRELLAAQKRYGFTPSILREARP